MMVSQLNKVIIASDSFKGSLSSLQVARAAAEAVREVFPDCETVCLEVADGGEGTSGALANYLKGSERITVEVHGPLGDTVKAAYHISGSTAVMEMSQASGLTLIPKERRNPLLTSSAGTGEMIADALDRGCRNFIVGIGGSATNDGGTGMMAALGWRFLDRNGREVVPCGGSLGEITAIDPSGARKELKDCSFTVACDVDTPFVGPKGAARVFAPQKGATPEMVETLEDGMVSFAGTVMDSTGTDISAMKGAGAAGGLGGAFAAFLGATLKPGSELVLEASGFDAKAAGADLVITGEGRMDSQTLRGKVPIAVLRHSQKLGIPAIAIAGAVEDVQEAINAGFRAVIPVTPEGMSIQDAMRPQTAMDNICTALKRFFNYPSNWCSS